MFVGVMRIMPYPPSFNNTAANTIEPAIGASTCAFGSQRCTPYSGIFTRKAIMHASHKMLFVSWLWPLGFNKVSIRKFELFSRLFRNKIAISSGREPNNV